MNINNYVKQKYKNTKFAKDLIEAFKVISSRQFFYAPTLSLNEYRDIINLGDNTTMCNAFHISLLRTLAQLDSNKDIMGVLIKLYKILEPNTIFIVQYVNIFLCVLSSTEALNYDIGVNGEMELDNNIAVQMLYCLLFETLPNNIEDYVFNSDFKNILSFTTVCKALKDKQEGDFYKNQSGYMLMDIYGDLSTYSRKEFLDMFKQWFAKVDIGELKYKSSTIDFIFLGYKENLIHTSSDLELLRTLAQGRSLLESLDILTGYVEELTPNQHTILHYLNDIQKDLIDKAIPLGCNCDKEIVNLMSECSNFNAVKKSLECILAIKGLNYAKET